MAGQPAPPQIMNTALFALGQEQVADLSPASLQASRAATKLLSQLDTARDIVLRRHGWTCTLTYATLPPATIAGYVAPRRWPFVYKLPGHYLRTWSIGGCYVGDYAGWGEWPREWRQQWEFGTLDISTGGQSIIRSRNGYDLDMAYVRRANWGAIDVHVQDAIAYELAARGAYSVTADLNLAKALQGAAEEKLLMAISIDGTQASPEDPLGLSHVHLARLMCE